MVLRLWSGTRAELLKESAPIPTSRVPGEDSIQRVGVSIIMICMELGRVFFFQLLDQVHTGWNAGAARNTRTDQGHARSVVADSSNQACGTGRSVKKACIGGVEHLNLFANDLRTDVLGKASLNS